MRRILLALFFLSGASSLIYQVVWTRELDLVFGVTAFAVATVLSAFMAGLSLGSLYFGKAVDRCKNPLVLFSLLETGIGVFAVFFPFLLSALVSIYTFIYQKLHVHFYLFSLIRFVLCFGILLIPSALMGGTLPVLSKFFLRRRNELGRDIASLYSVNNLGAAIGCLAAGFILIREIGVAESRYVAVLLNFVVAGIVLLLQKISRDYKREEQVKQAAAHEEASSLYPRYIVYLVFGVFGFEGFIALVYEVVWIRMLSSLVLSNSVYSYTITTVTFITGLTIGGYIISRLIDRIRNPLGLLALIEVAIGLSALLLLHVFKGLPFLFRDTSAVQKAIWGKSIGAEFIFAFLAMIIPATFMGSVFPLVSRICATDMRKIGERIGMIGFFDSIGSVLGPFAAGFIFIYFVGMQRSVIFMAFLNLVVGALLIIFHPAMKKKLLVLGMSICLYGLAFVFIPQNASYWRGSAIKSNKLLFYKEDANAVVTVTQKESIEGSDKFLEINGIDVAGTDYMLRTTQKAQAHLPLLLYEAANARKAQKILQVGLGSGGTSWSAMLHKPEELVCVELIPSVFKPAREQFREVNHGVFDDPAFKVVIEDGRNYMLASDTAYDVILTESIHPMFAGNANLYSKEYFELAANKLTENGILSIWVPLWALSLDDFRMIINTFYSVLPHTTVWYTSNFDSKQVHLIGSKKKLCIDFALWLKRMEDVRIQQDLREVRLDNPYKLLDALVMTEDDVGKYVAGAKLNTENRPHLEFSAPKSWYKDGHDIRRQNLESIVGFKKNAFIILDPETAGRGVEEKLSQYDRSSKYIFKGLLDYLKHDFEQSLHEFRQAASINPEDVSIEALAGIPKVVLENLYTLLGERDLKNGNYARAILAYTGLLDLNPKNPKAYNDRGLAFIGQGDFDNAIADLSILIELVPDNERAYINRGVAYTKKGLFDKAIEDFSHAIALAPENVPAYKYRGLVYEKLGNVELARKDSETVRTLQKRSPDVE